MRVAALLRLLLLSSVSSVSWLPLSGCTLFVGGLLQDAEDARAGEGEGEGEGDVGEGEGEGDVGEGEGEGDDPGCEDDERLVVITSDPDDPVHVFALVPGGFQPRVPTGFQSPDGALVDETGTAAGTLHAGAFRAGTIYLVDTARFYAVASSTLVQTDIRSGERVVRGSLFNGLGLAATPGYVIAGAGDLLGVALGAAPATPVEVLAGASFSDFQGVLTAQVNGALTVLAVHESGYEVLTAAQPDGRPLSTAAVDDDNRFNTNLFRRGNAYDATTGTLVIGDEGHLVFPRASNNFALPAIADDLALTDEFANVPAAAARNGVAYVGLASGSPNLLRVDLAPTPPAIVGAAVWNAHISSGTLIKLVAGCRRVIVVASGSGSNLSSVDPEDLSDLGGGPSISGVVDAFLVDKAELALVGD